MSSKERDEVLLSYILQSIGIIDQYVKLNTPTSLFESVVEDALLRRLETLSDAAGQLSEELRDRNPSVPWGQVVGFRNVLAHGYLTIDAARIKEAIEQGLPPLKKVVEAELESSNLY